MRPRTGIILLLALSVPIVGWAVFTTTGRPSVPSSEIESLESSTIRVLDQAEDSNPTGEWLERYAVLEVRSADRYEEAVQQVGRRLEDLDYKVRWQAGSTLFSSAVSEDVYVIPLPPVASNVPASASGQPEMAVEGNANTLVLVAMPLKD
jgi:hypothetical protein